MRFLSDAVAAISILFLTGVAAPAQQTQAAMREVLRVYSTLVDFSELSISPDGAHVAFRKTVHHDTTLWIARTGAQHAKRLTAGDTKGGVRRIRARVVA